MNSFKNEVYIYTEKGKKVSFIQEKGEKFNGLKNEVINKRNVFQQFLNHTNINHMCIRFYRWEMGGW